MDNFFMPTEYQKQVAAEFEAERIANLARNTQIRDFIIAQHQTSERRYWAAQLDPDHDRRQRYIQAKQVDHGQLKTWIWMLGFYFALVTLAAATLPIMVPVVILAMLASIFILALWFSHPKAGMAVSATIFAGVGASMLHRHLTNHDAN